MCNQAHSLSFFPASQLKVRTACVAYCFKVEVYRSCEYRERGSVSMGGTFKILFGEQGIELKRFWQLRIWNQCRVVLPAFLCREGGREGRLVGGERLKNAAFASSLLYSIDLGLRDQVYMYIVKNTSLRIFIQFWQTSLSFIWRLD